MKISFNVKCEDCGDVFRLTYDSHKENIFNYTSCKCGKLECKPSYYGGYEYKRGGNPGRLSIEERCKETMYYDEDVYKLTNEEVSLVDEINEIGKEIGKKIGFSFFDYSNEHRVSFELSFSGEFEDTDLTLEKNLLCEYGFSKEQLSKIHVELTESLTNYRDTLKLVRDKEVDLDNPEKIWDNKDILPYKDGNRKQVELYDYTFQF